MASTKCHYCRRKADYLCDFILRWGCRPKTPWREGMTDDEMVASLCDPGEARVQTCDRPLCEAHRVHRGHTFYCGEAGGVESLDYCPGHAGTALRGLPPYVPVGGGKGA